MGVLVVSKSFIIRDALEVLFNSEFIDYKVQGVKDIVEIKNIDLSKIEFIFLEIENDVLDIINFIKQSFNKIKIMIFDKKNNENFFVKSLRDGIDSYIIEIPEKDEFIHIVKKVLRGKKYYDTELLQNVIHNEQNNLIRLTHREQEVLKQVRKGLTNKEIAQELYITESTIKKHITSILSKLHMKNRKELIIYSEDRLYNII